MRWPMTVLPIREMGDPVLREVAREVTPEELASPEVQRLIDDMIETVREANGAGLAAPQVGVSKRIAVIEVRPGNPRYPYKPPIPLTVIVNPELRPLDEVTFATNEGCLSMPNVRGDLERFENVEARYLDRHGEAHTVTRRGLTAGTFQHEVDHLDGILFVDRMADMRSLSTWEEFERHGKAEFLARVEALVARVGS
ncbi:MAG TPA: peptide deformylase [Solirubrobacterales bacterium]|nr:peptide deformylase [Solirubrobacterales bacterium]